MPSFKKPRNFSTSDADTIKEGEMKAAKDHYRVVVMGAAGVGKTCIINMFLYEKFITEYKTTIEELHRGEYQVHGRPLTLDILDTSGSYQFPAMRRLSITTGDAFVLVYALHDESSFDEVQKLRQQILDEKQDELTPIVVVGNKCDVEDAERIMGKEEAESTVNIDWNNGYVEASAKHDINVVDIFKELLSQAKAQYVLSPALSRRRRRSLPNAKEPQKKDLGKVNKRNSCSIS